MLHLVYIREQSCFTLSSLANKLNSTHRETSEIVQSLAARGILRPQSRDKRFEYDSHENGQHSSSFQFVYVGLIVLNNHLLVVYPKYINDMPSSNPDTFIASAMQQIFQVLRKHNGKYSRIAAMNEDDAFFDSRLSLILMLLELYEEHGIYSRYEKTISDNGPGEISWERTIASTLPYIQHGRPIYINTKTKETARDDANYITCLHKAVITECTRFMVENGLSSFLSLGEAWLTDLSIEDHGDEDTILDRLRRERAVQFVTWKQSVIDLLVLYIQGRSMPAKNSIQPLCLGTTSFHHAWEVVCKAVFGDMLNRKLEDLGIIVSREYRNQINSKLLDLIPRPLWIKYYRDGHEPCGDVATFVPDIVTIMSGERNESIFAILDAKYYTPKLGKTSDGLPGVEDVAKQFLYQSAYRNFILSHDFHRVVNAFLVPTSGEDLNLIGSVSFPVLFDSLEPPFSTLIDMWAVPACEAYNSYLSGQQLDSCWYLSILNQGSVRHRSTQSHSLASP